MKMRTLVSILIVLVAAETAVQWHAARQQSNSGTAFVDAPLLDVKDLDRANRIVVREKPQSKVMQKGEDGFEVKLIVADDAPIRETVLERKGDGWVVANCFNLDVDATWLGQTMRDLRQGVLMRHLTADPTLMTDMDLHLGQVRLEDGQGHVIRQLDFGRKDGGSAYQFVRVDGRDTYVAKHETEIVGDPYAWIVNRVFTFPIADIRDAVLPLKNPHDLPLILHRPERGKPFEIAGDPVPDAARAAQNVEQILTHILNEPVMLAFERNHPAPQAAHQHLAAHLHIVLFDGRTYDISYGVVPPEDPALKSMTEDVRNDLAFSWVECSDPNDIVMRYGAKAVLAYNKNAIVSRLPESRATAAGKPPARDDDAPVK
jgi:hypothetical protein